MNNELKIAIANKLDSRSAQELLTRFAEQDAELWYQTTADLQSVQELNEKHERKIAELTEDLSKSKAQPKGWVFPKVGDKLRLTKDFSMDGNMVIVKAGEVVEVSFYTCASIAPDYKSEPAIGTVFMVHCIPLTHLEPA